MKTCSSCQILKEDDEFNFKNRKDGTRQSRCRTCTTAYMKDWYKANRERVAGPNSERRRAWGKDRKANVTQIVYAIKSNPCADCLQSFSPWQMQFDHRPKEPKKFNVSSAIQQGRPLEAILKEIEKCDLVCANCHADRTYRRSHAGETT